MKEAASNFWPSESPPAGLGATVLLAEGGAVVVFPEKKIAEYIHK